MKKYKYLYDIKSGHFIKKHINEDDNNSNVSTDTDNNNQNSVDTSDLSSQLLEAKITKSIDSVKEIQQITLEVQKVDKKYQEDMILQNRLLETAKVKASEKEYNGPYDPVNVDPDVINILKKINFINKTYYMKKYEIEEKRLALLTKLASETNENRRYKNIPKKYRFLTESNINTAKVYMGNLVGNDEDLILKNMHDFKKVFRKTNLLYGKDNVGYFVIAIDSDDLNTLSDTLEEQGYLRDEILDTVMPLILDRTGMIS